jgi:predicted RNase H-like HicB family nuclease
MICNIATQTPSPPPMAQPQLDRMNSIWYWTVLDRESDGFVASVPDLGDLAAYGASEKEAVAHVAERASEYVRALVESGKPAPRARHATEMPSTLKIGRAMICVWLGGAKRAP